MKCKSCNSPSKHGCYYCKDCSPGMAPKQKQWGETKDNRTIRRLLIHDRGYKCEVCKLTKWQGKDIPLDLDHIDGDSDNCDKKNVRLICPNCHALTPTYKSKNRGKESKRQQSRRLRYSQGKTY